MGKWEKGLLECVWVFSFQKEYVNDIGSGATGDTCTLLSVQGLEGQNLRFVCVVSFAAWHIQSAW